MTRNFKEELEEDLTQVFFNEAEYAENHIVEGKTIIAVIDDDINVSKKDGVVLSLQKGSIKLFAKDEDLPKRKSIGSLINLDGKEYFIDSWFSKNGMAEITCHANVSR